jgi:hypothetical protein
MLLLFYIVLILEFLYDQFDLTLNFIPRAKDNTH